MHAAAAGKSTLGIPKSVGAEFVAADKGGKLPAKREASPRKRGTRKPLDYGAMVEHAKKY